MYCIIRAIMLLAMVGRNGDDVDEDVSRLRTALLYILTYIRTVLQ